MSTPSVPHSSKKVAIFVDLENNLGAGKYPGKRSVILTEIVRAVTQLGLQPCANLLRTYASKKKRTDEQCAVISKSITACGFMMRWSDGIADTLLIADIHYALNTKITQIVPEILIIVSDDNDFCNIARLAQNRGKEVWIISKKFVHSNLQRLANRRFVIKSTTVIEVYSGPKLGYPSIQKKVETPSKFQAWQLTITLLHLKDSTAEDRVLKFLVPRTYSREWLFDWAQSRLSHFGQIEIREPIAASMNQIWTLQEICSYMREEQLPFR